MNNLELTIKEHANKVVMSMIKSGYPLSVVTKDCKEYYGKLFVDEGRVDMTVVSSEIQRIVDNEYRKSTNPWERVRKEIIRRYGSEGVKFAEWCLI